MELELVKVLLYILGVIIVVSATTIPIAFILTWLDSKGIIDKEKEK